MLSTWDTKTFEPQWFAQHLDEGRSVTFTAAGQLKFSDPDVVAQECVYVVETDDGTLQMLKPSEFQKLIPATASTKSGP